MRRLLEKPRALALGLAVIALGGLASLTWASPRRSRAVNVLTSSSTRIQGGAAGDRAGASVASAGDVNGDGRPDIIIGAPLADGNARLNSGSAFVVFGPLGESKLDLGALGERGFRIDGAVANDHAGLAVDGAGDVNGDGLADLVVAAPDAGQGGDGGSRGWATFVVFGKATTADVDLAALGDGGYEIDGAGYSDTANRIAAGAGDVNGDGRADTIVGSPFSKDRAGRYIGGAYVVFGSSSLGTVDLNALGSRGFRIVGSPDFDDEGPYSSLYRTGLSVDGVGDVNEDGRSDVVVGSTIGVTYLIFGKTTTDPVVLARLAGQGFGIADDDFGTAGSAVAGAGDVNGDKRSDVIVSNSDLEVGFNAFVVFGKRSRGVVRLRSLNRSRRGFEIMTSKADTGADHDVAAAGDVNGDGLADVIVSAVLIGNHGKTRKASSYVVFGRRSLRPVKLARLGRGGMRLAGATVRHSEYVPFPRVAGVGDVVGDGRSDVAVTNYLADADGKKDSGSTYVVSGSSLVARAR